MRKTDAIVLLSGGLDSLLAARLLMNMDLNVLCVHFTTPFFGSQDKINEWQEKWRLTIRPVDISEQFVGMLAEWPEHGPGQTLNPCIDCKILMLKMARQIMEAENAKFIATGEVLGQRPMSQRTESLNTIAKKAGVKEFLLRPLSANLLPPTLAQEKNLVRQQDLLSISGRGRNAQFELARKMGFAEWPAPGGGCKLTELESARRYWPLLTNYKIRNKPGTIAELVDDMRLCNHGRFHFSNSTGLWFCVGRNEASNNKIAKNRKSNDLILRLPFAGPLALARNGKFWSTELLAEAAAILIKYSKKAAQMPCKPLIRAYDESGEYEIRPACEDNISAWTPPAWEEVKQEIKAERKRHMPAQKIRVMSDSGDVCAATD